MNVKLGNSIWDTPQRFDRFLVITPAGKDVTFKKYSPPKIGKEIRNACFLKQTNSEIRQISHNRSAKSGRFFLTSENKNKKFSWTTSGSDT